MQVPNITGYEILDKIADGGMATVWKARQTSLDRLVALKVLNTQIIRDEYDIQGFRREAQAAARLHHSGLCQIYDAGEENGVVFYAMEYVAGLSVGQLLNRKGRLSEAQALMITFGAASVLEAIWSKYQVIHCDIKPDNLLVDDDGSIRVADFGVARFMGQMAQHADKEYFVGTPNYTSPEQVYGTENLDFRTDIYGLGTTLYHMLTGVLPFGGVDPEHAMEQHVSGYLEDPTEIDPTVSNQAAYLVEKMMVKRQRDRYRDWNGLLLDIQEVRSGRMPRGALIPFGQSTVRRTEARHAALQMELRTMQPGIAPARPKQRAKSAPPQDKRVMTVAKSPPVGAVSSSGYLGARSTQNTLPALATALLLLLLVVAAYAAAYFYFLSDRSPSEPAPSTVVPPRTTVVNNNVPRPAPRTGPERENRPERPVAPPVDRRPPEPVQPPEPAWPPAEYNQAMRLLQGASSTFQTFLQSRDQALLDQVEADCRAAIELLEAIRDDAPAQARVGETIRQAYQMIFNVRQSRTMGGR